MHFLFWRSRDEKLVYSFLPDYGTLGWLFVFNFQRVENYIEIMEKRKTEKEWQEIFYFIEFFKNDASMLFHYNYSFLKIFEKNLYGFLISFFQFQIGKWWSIFIREKWTIFCFLMFNISKKNCLNEWNDGNFRRKISKRWKTSN